LGFATESVSLSNSTSTVETVAGPNDWQAQAVTTGTSAWFSFGFSGGQTFNSVGTVSLQNGTAVLSTTVVGAASGGPNWSHSAAVLYSPAPVIPAGSTFSFDANCICDEGRAGGQGNGSGEGEVFGYFYGLIGGQWEVLSSYSPSVQGEYQSGTWNLNYTSTSSITGIAIESYSEALAIGAGVYSEIGQTLTVTNFNITEPVPEPTSFTLFVTALLGIGAASVVRRRRAAA